MSMIHNVLVIPVVGGLAHLLGLCEQISVSENELAEVTMSVC